MQQGGPAREMVVIVEEVTMPKLEVYTGKRITARRITMGLSVEALAKRSGLTPLRLQAYEAGTRRLIPDDLFRICNALGTGPAYFYEGAPSPDGSADEGETEEADKPHILCNRSLRLVRCLVPG